MKDKLLKTIFLGVVLMSAFILFGCAKKVSIGKIKSFSYSYTTGYYANAGWRYELKYNDDVYTARVKPDAVDIEDANEYTVDKEFAEKLESILKEYDVGSWNGFDKNNKLVLDGDSFHLNVYFMDDTEIGARGYMKWPKNYGEVRNAIDELFRALVQ